MRTTTGAPDAILPVSQSCAVDPRHKLQKNGGLLILCAHRRTDPAEIAASER